MIASNLSLPKILESFRIGNSGEAYLEFIMSKHCLMHKISGYKDIGLDYLCEWLVGSSPTRILFGIQVKTSSLENIEIKPLGRNKGLNGLEKYQFAHTPSWNIEVNTINYWLGFEIPLYLFFVFKNNSEFDCYYQRLTPKLHKKDRAKAIQQVQDYKDNELYKVNNGSDFRAIIPRGEKDGGFARDLFFDSVRCAYYSGSPQYRDSREFGLKGWEGDHIYLDVLGEGDCPYVERVQKTLTLFEKLKIVSINSGWEQQIRDLKAKTDDK